MRKNTAEDPKKPGQNVEATAIGETTVVIEDTRQLVKHKAGLDF